MPNWWDEILYLLQDKVFFKAFVKLTSTELKKRIVKTILVMVILNVIHLCSVMKLCIIKIICQLTKTLPMSV